jgi:alpha-tubulin suppressor-like RCC1 family protein
VFASGSHTCGATTDNLAYCWGANNFGQLGDGTRTDGKKPVAVAGGLSFRQVMAGSGFVEFLTPEAPDVAFTCGVITDNRAYCWGDNGGHLGNGTTDRDALTPVAVSGGHRFSVVDPGGLHTCGVALNAVAFCWGDNSQGQLGDGSFGNRAQPIRVAGGLRFNNVSTSLIGTTTCGVTTDNRAYCWGNNSSGQLGDGNGGFGIKSPRPVAVVGPT